MLPPCIVLWNWSATFSTLSFGCFLRTMICTDHLLPIYSLSPLFALTPLFAKLTCHPPLRAAAILFAMRDAIPLPHFPLSINNWYRPLCTDFIFRCSVVYNCNFFTVIPQLSSLQLDKVISYQVDIRMNLERMKWRFAATDIQKRTELKEQIQTIGWVGWSPPYMRILRFTMFDHDKRIWFHDNLYVQFWMSDM